MRLKLTAAFALAATVLVTWLTLAPTVDAAFSAPNLTSLPVAGTINSIGGTFNGTLDVQRLALQNGQLVAKGTLTGNALNSAGNAIGSVTDTPVTLPMSSSGTGSCQIADLTLGATHLDVLGLVVQLDPVHLNITAQQGSGNLLGNLLCMVANLLNSNSSSFALQPIVSLLNQLIAGL
jgi:hypothetical protein